jgi:NAD-dependent deacetylase
MKKSLVVLSGAGISAESGIKTFRDSDGLWNGYKVQDVATYEAFERDPAMVLDFYNMRRKDVQAAQPNDAHKILVELEEYFDVQIITQNIDDLHERAGSKNVLHLHGEILKMKGDGDESKYYPITKDILLGEKDNNGRQFRPHVVWFGEAVPMIEPAYALCYDADLMLVVGTSLVVYPAAGLTRLLPNSSPMYVVDKHIPPDLPGRKLLTKIEEPATTGMLKLKEMILPLA